AHTSYIHFLLGLGGKKPDKSQMKITHIWGDDYSKNYTGKALSGLSKNSRFPAEYIAQESDAELVKSPEDMVKHVDAAMVMDFDNSSNLAEPFLKAGIPIFVNRPYAATMADARKILDMAEKTGTAAFSGSLLQWIFETRKLRFRLDREKLVAFHTDAVSQNFSRYVTHGFEFIYGVVGPQVKRVRVSGWDGSGGYDPQVLPEMLFELEYEPTGDAPPVRGTLFSRPYNYPHNWWFRGYQNDGTVIESDIQNHEGLTIEEGDNHWLLPFLSIVEQVFRTNTSPQTREDILHKHATLLAAHKSAVNGGRWIGLDEVEGHSLPSVIISHWSEKI
ncbi:Gfo/Idh/MocA family oxidoreductase, partial [Candidatus Latescibacterota bacterium]